MTDASELLNRPELRPVRLQLEYLQPQLALRDAGIQHTIVVFGSTRLVAPEVARAQLEEARRLQAALPDSADARNGLERAERVLERSRYYEIGRELGQLVGRHAEATAANRLAIMTGGGPGGMEAANRGAADLGAASIGLNIVLPHEQPQNPYVSPELSFHFRYFALRKLHFMLRARALVALPGGYGTLDELFETLCLIQTGKRAPLPVVLIGRRFWLRAIDFEYLLAEEMIDVRDRALFSVAETAQEAWDTILGWYAERGRSIVDPSPPSE